MPQIDTDIIAIITENANIIAITGMIVIDAFINR